MKYPFLFYSMKLIYIFIILPFLAIGQAFDNTWLLGYVSGTKEPDTTSGYGLMKMKFGINEIPKVAKLSTYSNKIENILNMASICNDNGDLILYYDGIDLYDKNLSILKGSDTLNYNDVSNTPSEPQNGIIFPMPEQKNKYILFNPFTHIWTDSKNNTFIANIALYSSIVDITKNNGLGEVVERKKLIFKDTLSPGKLATCRHSNGRDWWIICQRLNSNIWYKFLLTPQGVKLYDKQTIGVKYMSGGLQAVFSPDGKYYALSGNNDNKAPDAVVFDFDRCTGQLSNQRTIDIKGVYFAGGVAISPNSRYIYYSCQYIMYQYDLWESDLQKSQKIVGYDDGVKEPFSTNFNLLKLAPDNKIYMTSSTGMRYLHVINKPDESGDSCQFVQRGLKLPNFHSFGLPNYPNFKLGAATIKCTTETEEENEKKEIVKLFPNPAQNELTLTFNATYYQKGIFHLTDLQGRRIASYPILPDHDEYRFDISAIPNGMYLWQLVLDDKILQTGKVAVMKE
jgi:Secretion system C-terminal sorting domain